MNCQEALNLLYDIIDREASDIDAQQVQEHLESCQHCFKIYKVEGAINEFIKARVQEDKNEVHVENLRLKIIHQLDTIDVSGNTASNPSTTEASQPGSPDPNSIPPDIKKRLR